jgi:hypothetical protein
MKIIEILGETATAGATSSANIGTVTAPQLSPGRLEVKNLILDLLEKVELQHPHNQK